MMDMGEPAAAPVGHVVLCGLNELGYRTLEELIRLGEDVVVIVGSPAEELARGARELGATLVPGNYRDQAVLRAAGVPVAGALVITEDDDVGNLHAALAAQELNPAMRMRLRMFNRELGRRVQELFEDCQVFDSAALAVPAFVSAALLQDWQQRVEVHDRTLAVRQAAATEPGVLLPLARVQPDGTAELFPDTDEPVLCLAEAPSPARWTRHPQRPAPKRPGRLAAAWTVLLQADVRLRVMTAIVLGLALTGIAIFWWFSEQHLDLIDAIYFTVTIMTTTGFGDIHLRNAPPLLQLYGVALMLSGTAALAILFALITDALISARLVRVLGANIPRGLHDHVVVCGLGNIGYRMVEQLHELGVPLVAAELHETNRYLPAVRRLGVPVLVADIRLPATLELLHVDRARSVVVVTSSDIVNLETALNVQSLAPQVRVVLRLFDLIWPPGSSGPSASTSPAVPRPWPPPPLPPPRPGSTSWPPSRWERGSWPWCGCGSSSAAAPRATPWPSLRGRPAAGCWSWTTARDRGGGPTAGPSWPAAPSWSPWFPVASLAASSPGPRTIPTPAATPRTKRPRPRSQALRRDAADRIQGHRYLRRGRAWQAPSGALHRVRPAPVVRRSIEDGRTAGPPS
jgi:Trk K+ transport system NAD-binding subunit